MQDDTRKVHPAGPNVKAFNLSKPLGFRTSRLPFARAMSPRRQLDQQKPLYFNVLCVGRERVGKSPFLDDLILKIFNKQNIIDHREQKFVEYTSEKRENGRRVVITCIDSWGYCEEYPVDKWYTDIKHYLKGKVNLHSSDGNL